MRPLEAQPCPQLRLSTTATRWSLSSGTDAQMSRSNTCGTAFGTAKGGESGRLTVRQNGNPPFAGNLIRMRTQCTALGIAIRGGTHSSCCPLP
jgi:hypothetical protein